MSRLHLRWICLPLGLVFFAALAFAPSTMAQEQPTKELPAESADDAAKKPAETPAVDVQKTPNAAEGQKLPELPADLLVLPTAEIYPQEVLTEEFQDCQTKPFGDESLAFQITVRKSWKWETLTLRSNDSKTRFVPVCYVSGPDAGGIPVAIDASYRTIEREVDMEDYLELCAEDLGYEILKDQWGTFSGRVVYEMLCRAQIRGTDSLVRLALSHDGSRFFLVAGTCPVAGYAQYAKDIGVAVVSFRLLNPTGKAYAEEMALHKMTGAENASFLYPKTWKLEASTRLSKGIAAFDIRHGTEEASVVGWIRVKVVARSAYPEAGAPEYVFSFFEELNKGGMVFDNPVFDAKVAGGGKFLEGGRYLILPVFAADTVSEARLVVLPTAKAWYVLSLISPTRERGILEWMVNKRAFEIIQDTLIPE